MALDGLLEWNLESSLTEPSEIKNMRILSPCNSTSGYSLGKTLTRVQRAHIISLFLDGKKPLYK